MNRFLSFAIFHLFIFSSLFGAIDPNETPLTFQYAKEQLEPFINCPAPNDEITNEQLTQLNKEVAYLIKTAELTPIESTILPAYLANAQKDFAWISYRLKGKFAGDLGPVTLWTLQLFIKDATLPSVSAKDFDPFSSGVAALVVSKAADRLNKEKKEIAEYPIKKGPDLWSPTSPGYRGIEYGTAKPWYLSSSNEFIVDTPSNDASYWKEQSGEVMKAMKSRNGAETELVFWWANLPSPDSGEWSAILQKYFDKNNTPLAARLYAKALFESAYLDSNAVSFNSKYTFWIKRPSQTNPAIKPLIAIPNHPSYPSAHSTISSTVAVILTELFPDNEKEWNALAEQAGMSRIWGGIHYPADHKSGMKLGEKIGHAILNRSSQTQKIKR